MFLHSSHFAGCVGVARRVAGFPLLLACLSQYCGIRHCSFKVGGARWHLAFAFLMCSADVELLVAIPLSNRLSVVAAKLFVSRCGCSVFRAHNSCDQCREDCPERLSVSVGSAISVDWTNGSRHRVGEIHCVDRHRK